MTIQIVSGAQFTRLHLWWYGGVWSVWGCMGVHRFGYWLPFMWTGRNVPINSWENLSTLSQSEGMFSDKHKYVLKIQSPRHDMGGKNIKRAHEIPICSLEILICSLEILICSHEILICSHEILIRSHEILIRSLEILICSLEINITCARSTYLWPRNRYNVRTTY